ncbi:hypothetical protein PV379_04415 [Streptomyces caniscabiei]|uniref:hypothetical protein n=1 Tax=Streptomyces caniscabiei TaxID=2746961 RepID=UPI0029A9A25C|nr:hypothetical protein [Streptomyces caniscabiei]MDX2776581.1 hypothetical protein [Streptomyces caniscabiei]
MGKQKDTVKGSVYHYRFIDHGAQYRVYAIYTADGEPTGRVVKVPLTFDESKRVLMPYLTPLGLDEEEIDRRIHQLMLRKQQLPRLVQGMFARDQRLVRSLGNLKLVPILAAPPKSSPEYMLPLYFTQDYVMPMAQFMHTFRFMRQRAHKVTIHDARRARQLMRAIVELHYHLWEYGIFDMTFKLENVGVVLQGDKVVSVVLVDGAEHTYDFDEAAAIIAERKWRNCLNTAKLDHLFLPVILHEEYAAIMARGLTEDALRKRWQKKSRSLEKRKLLELKARQLVTRDVKKKLAVWMERQSLHEELHQGIPRSCIDTTNIPYADLLLLLNDTRAGTVPLDAIASQEKAERTMYEQADSSTAEIYRHTLRLPRNI